MRKEPQMKLKKAGIITKIVVIALLVYGLVTLVVLAGKIDDVKAEQALLSQEAQELEVQNAEMDYAIEHSTDDDVISDIARDELGLVDPDDKVFYDSDN